MDHERNPSGFAEDDLQQAVNHLVRLGALPADAADAVQEAALAVWRARPDADRALLVGTLRIRSEQRWRSAMRRQQPEPVPPASLDRAGDEMDPARWLVFQESVWNAMQDLPHRQREDLVADVQGVSIEAIARRTGRKVQTVASSISKARRAVADRCRAARDRLDDDATRLVLVAFAGHHAQRIRCMVQACGSTVAAGVVLMVAPSVAVATVAAAPAAAQAPGHLASPPLAAAPAFGRRTATSMPTPPTTRLPRVTRPAAGPAHTATATHLLGTGTIGDRHLASTGTSVDDTQDGHTFIDDLAWCLSALDLDPHHAGCRR